MALVSITGIGWGRALGLGRHRAWRIVRRIAALSLAARYAVLNRTSKLPVVDPSSGAVVSLTSYGDRMATVHLTIESIARGSVRPARLILWLDRGQRPSRRLLALAVRGLEVVETEGRWGPHKKYYPYCSAHADEGKLLVTADDDVFYHRGWLEELLPRVDGERVVRCHRARRIAFDRDRTLAPYLLWPLVADVSASVLHMATGVGGVAYPPTLQRALRDAGETFMATHGRTDDIWLHLQQLRSGFAVQQVRLTARAHLEVPLSQRGGLALTNQIKSHNDRVLSTTYSGDELRRLREMDVRVDHPCPVP